MGRDGLAVNTNMVILIRLYMHCLIAYNHVGNNPFYPEARNRNLNIECDVLIDEAAKCGEMRGIYYSR